MLFCRLVSLFFFKNLVCFGHKDQQDEDQGPNQVLRQDK